ncbi:X-linked retinitis pigmentosa GTPase regulator-like isoform X2 [Orbicella faveolata]|uniref:X-linked retinitis pigmentosa GTPase regulator-like isoform X2 n=1 Tax=Orbicella faveolata TaxID=48498 RepID=UPI0009E32493|nr:X-linked retinitis pigmentosa GTPase regulator-like isoform X2 [Orbicella faveolata]
MASDDEDVPDSGAVFTFGKSRFLDNKFWIRDDAVIHLACGDEHSAVVTENGKLYTFGSNDWGQLGHGSTVQFPNPKLVKRLKPEKVNMVAAGRNHTIVSTESGKLYSFGCGSDGQLGHGNCENSQVPKAIESLNDQQYKMLACGSDFTAAVTADGRLYTWGSSSEGQTGQGDEDYNVPTQVQIRGKVVAVGCGYYHMAVVTDDGSLYTCGENESGKLGLDDSQLSETSQLQKLFSINEQFITVACGGNHTVAVTRNGKLYTFGQGDHGQLGHGSSWLECQTPKQVSSLGNIRVQYVACGESHTAVITKHGNLYTCGDGRHGKLGMGEESFSNLFKLEKVTRFDNFMVQKVACGGCHTLVIAVKTTENSDGTDSEAEAEKDILAASVSSTKSLQDVVDGPSGYSGGLSSTFPVGGAARNKRRQRNVESLGNSVGGGSLPPISKSTLPPLSRTLPVLKKEVSKEEKMPVNPLDMSTLPKISREEQEKDQRKNDSDKENKLSASRKTKVTNKPAKKPKDAESSSGISESEDDEDENEEEDKKKASQTTSLKEKEKKVDTKKTGEESEESMTEDESDSVEEEPSDKKKTAAAAATKQVETVSTVTSKEGKKDKEEDEDEESGEDDEDDEESDEEDEDEESPEEGKKSEKSETLKVVGKKIEVTKVKKTTNDDEEEEEEEEEEEDSEEEESEEEDEDEEEEDKANKQKEQQKKSDKKSEVKDKDKKAVSKKKQEAEEDSEEEEEEDDDDEDEENEEEDRKKEEEQTKDATKDKKSKEKTEDKKKKDKDKKKEDEDNSDKKTSDDKKEKKNKDKKGKEKDNVDEEDDEDDEHAEENKDDEEEDEEEGKSKDKGDKEEKNGKGKTDKKDKKDDKADKPEAGKTKEKKSGICAIL